MSYQTSGNILVALKAEVTTGVALSTVTGAQQLRIVDSPGLKLNRAVVQSEENRADGTKTMGRLGYKSVDGSYNGELAPGGATDVCVEAIMRSSWVTANAIAFSSLTSCTIGTNEVVANAGDWVGDQGIRVGDVFRLSNTVANDDTNLRVTAVSSLTISTAAGELTADASAATTGTLTVLRKITTAATPTRRSFNVEQYDKDTDLSELFLGCRLTGLSLSCQPGEMATATYSFVGMDRTALAVGTSPFFTSPTLTTDLGMIADDSAIQKDGVAITDFTGFDLNFQIDAAGQPVIGSLTSPDIFDNDLTVSGTITGLREDFTYIDLYDAETEFELSILLETAETDPDSCLGIFLPRVKIAALSAPVGGGDGAKVETRELMIGAKAAATGYDGTIAVFHTSETA
jgi:hypothetical protein